MPRRLARAGVAQRQHVLVAAVADTRERRQSPIPPKRSRTPWRRGSRASKRVPRLACMQTDALGRAVVNGHEDGRPLGDGHRGRHVGAPHHVRRLGGDRAVVRRRATPGPRGAGPGGRRALIGAPAPANSPRSSPRGSPHHETATPQAGGCGPPGPRPNGPAAMPARAVPRCLPPRIASTAAVAHHTPDGWRSTGRRSSRRPPAGQRAAGLQLVAYSNSIRSSPIWPAADGGRRPPPRSLGSSSRPGPPPKTCRATARPAPP